MSKTGIVAYILAAIFVVFCFWMVGCGTDSGTGTSCPTYNENGDSTGTWYGEGFC